MLRNLIATSLLLPMTFACAPFQQASASPLTPDQSALIDATCTKVMGLKKGEYYFEQCQDSLSHSMARKVAAEASVTAYDICRNRGLAEGSSAFSVCVLNGQDNATNSTRVELQPIDLASAADVLKSGKSYYGVTPSVQWQRYRYSCAQLGLVPNSGLFGTCVASLAGELSPNTD